MVLATNPIPSNTFQRKIFMPSIGRGFPFLLSVALVLGSLITTTGCEQKEKILDIETPAGNIQVERSKGNGKVDVDVQVDREK